MGQIFTSMKKDTTYGTRKPDYPDFRKLFSGLLKELRSY